MVVNARKQGLRRSRGPLGRTALRCLVAVQTKAIGMIVGESGLGGALWLSLVLWLWWQALLAFGYQRTTGDPLRVYEQGISVIT